jgi:hypothetical protein
VRQGVAARHYRARPFHLAPLMSRPELHFAAPAGNQEDVGALTPSRVWTTVDRMTLRMLRRELCLLDRAIDGMSTSGDVDRTTSRRSSPLAE